jgi:hypothetical protein
VLSVKDIAERSREKSSMLQGFGDAVLWAEALEEQLLKSRKHAAEDHVWFEDRWMVASLCDE